MEAVSSGVGRETAHEAIKEHAVATIRDLRAGAIQTNDLVTRLANDERISLNQEQLEAIFEDEARLSGMAKHQVEALAKRAEAIAEVYPTAKDYRPGSIL